MVHNKLEKAVYNSCEATGCEAPATEKSSISAGSFGTIELNLCKSCIGIFMSRRK
jgi:hypothetical protein